MKQFFITLRESIWSPKFYEVMGSRTSREGIRYFLSLMFFASFIIIVVGSIFVVPAAVFGTNMISRLVSEHYPADLTITLRNGIASTTPLKVYKLPISGEIWSPSEISRLSSFGISNILVIDTESKFENISQFNNAKAFALLNKDSIALRAENGFEVKSLEKIPDITITKSFIQNILYRLTSLLKYMLPLLIVLGFIGMFIFSSMMYIVLAAIAALLMWALNGLTKRTGGYKEFFVTALYATTLPVLIDLALLLLGRPNSFHSLTVILIIVLVWVFNVKIWVKPNLPMVKN